MRLYLVFSGTTDHRGRLFGWLNSGGVSGYTALRSSGGWQGAVLEGDVLLFFDEADAKAASKFLLTECGQMSAPILSLNATEVTPQCA